VHDRGSIFSSGIDEALKDLGVRCKQDTGSLAESA
jgi:hypothetical protein